MIELGFFVHSDIWGTTSTLERVKINEGGIMDQITGLRCFKCHGPVQELSNGGGKATIYCARCQAKQIIWSMEIVHPYWKTTYTITDLIVFIPDKQWENIEKMLASYSNTNGGHLE